MLPILLAVHLSAPPIYPVDGLRPGQKGHCLTVFEGNAIEPFDFVVKGVMRNFLGPKSDVVLVRLQGQKPEFTGVVAGMSGSPCMIDGKLLGALSYAFATFAKEPIAGITPYDGMRAVMQLPTEALPWRIAATNKNDWQALQQGHAQTKRAASNDAAGLRPIATPLGMAGMPPSVIEHFSPYLRDLGFEPMAAGFSGGSSAVHTKLEPGSPVAALLVRGDVEIAATGTVTTVEGDEVLAFGHPFLGAGAISIPMASATIINTMASEMRSFKMSLAGPSVGELTQDRLTAIGGYLGRKPSLVPVRGAFSIDKNKGAFNLEIARDQSLTPRFVAMGLAGALEGRVEAGARGMVRLSGKIAVQGMQPIRIENVYAAERDGNLMVRAAVEMAQAFAAMWDTPFGAPPTMSVDVNVALSTTPVEEWIDAISVDRVQLRPGQPVEVAVRVKRNDGPTTVERFAVQVPRTWAGEEVQIVAAGSRDAETLVMDVEGEPRPTKLEHIGRWLSERRPDGHIYLMVVRAGEGVQLDARALPLLPPSAAIILGDNPDREAIHRGLAWEERRARPGVVDGAASTTLRVLNY